MHHLHPFSSLLCSLVVPLPLILSLLLTLPSTLINVTRADDGGDFDVMQSPLPAPSSQDMAFQSSHCYPFFQRGPPIVSEWEGRHAVAFSH